MTTLLPQPEQQFLDANGDPLAGGTIGTFVPATMTPKATWIDSGQITSNTQPVVLDSAGRAIIYGSGAYRFIVKDSLGNLIYDQLTQSTLPEDAISAALLPVTSAATLATARSLLGVDAAIAAAVSAIELMPGPVGPAGSVGSTGATGPTGASGGGYIPSFTASNPGFIALPGINGTAQNFYLQFGNGATNSGGTATISFATAFPNACLGVVANNTDTATGSWWVSSIVNNNSSFRAVSSSPLHGGGWQGGPMTFNWLAWGY